MLSAHRQDIEVVMVLLLAHRTVGLGGAPRLAVPPSQRVPQSLPAPGLGDGACSRCNGGGGPPSWCTKGFSRRHHASPPGGAPTRGPGAPLNSQGGG